MRQASRRGAEISLLHSVADDSRISLAHSFVAVPSLLPQALAEIVVAAAQGAGKPVPPALAGIEPVAAAVVIAASLLSGERKAVLLGISPSSTRKRPSCWRSRTRCPISSARGSVA